MPALGHTATQAVLEKLKGEAGLPSAIAAVSERESVPLAVVDASQVLAQQVATETAERSAGVRYPAVYCYCAGLNNTLKEKFRRFSGRVSLVVEVRVSHDRLEGVVREAPLYAAAITDVLDGQRGDWGEGLFYTGGYKVEFGPIKHGGKNFLQVARVTFEVEASY